MRSTLAHVQLVLDTYYAIVSAQKESLDPGCTDPEIPASLLDIVPGKSIPAEGAAIWVIFGRVIFGRHDLSATSSSRSSQAKEPAANLAKYLPKENGRHKTINP